MRIDMMHAHRGRLPDCYWWEWFISPWGILLICAIVLVGLLYIPALPRESEGVVTVSEIIGTSAPGYLSARTWTLTFEEQPGTYQVVYAGSHISQGDRFELLRRLDGDYTIRSLTAER